MNPQRHPQRHTQGLAFLAAVLLLGAVVATVVLTGTHPADGPTARPAATDAGQGSVVAPSGARTQLSGLTPATGEPTLPGLATAAPRPGTVAEVAGPFDDRFGWAGLAFDGRAVTGALSVTSDVSDLLELEVVAGFYDRDGRLLGTRRFVHHASVHDESGDHLPVEREQVSIRVPRALATSAVAASVGVPVLVNE